MSDLLTVEEVAELLRVPPSWVYQHKGRIPHIKVGKYLRFGSDELKKWIDEQYAQ